MVFAFGELFFDSRTAGGNDIAENRAQHLMRLRSLLNGELFYGADCFLRSEDQLLSCRQNRRKKIYKLRKRVRAQKYYWDFSPFSVRQWPLLFPLCSTTIVQPKHHHRADRLCKQCRVFGWLGNICGGHTPAWEMYELWGRPGNYPPAHSSWRHPCRPGTKRSSPLRF